MLNLQYQELPTDSNIVITFQLPLLFSTSSVRCAFPSLRASSPIWASKASLRLTRPNRRACSQAMHSPDGPPDSPDWPYFSESKVNVSKVMCLVPEVLMSSSDTTINAEIQFYRDDLCHRLSVVVVELVRWRRKWSEVADKSSLPTSACSSHP